MGSTLKKRQPSENSNRLEIFDSVLSGMIRDDKVEELLEIIYTRIKQIRKDDYKHYSCLQWARNKIKENRFAARVLKAYKKNPAVISMAVSEVEGQLDLMEWEK